MVYKFVSRFDRDDEYTVEADESLELYDVFSLSISKVNRNNKSFGDDNINCVLKYSKMGVAGMKIMDLDPSNFSGYHIFVERFKRKNDDSECLSLGVPLDMIPDGDNDGLDNVSMDSLDNDTRLAFNEFLKDDGLVKILLKCFLKGVAYGKRKK